MHSKHVKVFGSAVNACRTYFSASRYTRTHINRMENTERWMTPHELVAWSKDVNGVRKLNSRMNNTDIRIVIRWLGDHTYDTVWLEDGKTRLGLVGISNILFITMIVFPKFYVRHKLWQRN